MVSTEAQSEVSAIEEVVHALYEAISFRFP